MTDELKKNLPPLSEAATIGSRESFPVEAPPSLDTNQEQLGTPEAGIQISKEGFLEETIDSLKHTLRISKRPRSTRVVQVRDDLTVKVEHIMQAGLEEAYRELPIVKQQEFKIKGEQTAQAVRQLLRATHVKVKKIFKLILEWLRLLPGINKFYLEQEAKIKADRIASLKDFDHRV